MGSGLPELCSSWTSSQFLVILAEIHARAGTGAKCTASTSASPAAATLSSGTKRGGPAGPYGPAGLCLRIQAQILPAGGSPAFHTRSNSKVRIRQPSSVRTASAS